MNVREEAQRVVSEVADQLERTSKSRKIRREAWRQLARRCQQETPEEGERREIEGTRIAIVEGKEDVSVVQALLEMLAVESVEVHKTGGKDKKLLVEKVETLEAVRGWDRVEKVGFIVDADKDASEPKNDFDNIRPTLPKGRQYSIWVMPDDTGPGALEDLLLAAAEGKSLKTIEEFREMAEEDKTWVVKASTGREESNGKNLHSYGWESLRYGGGPQSAKGGVNGNHSVFDGLKQYLKELGGWTEKAPNGIREKAR